METVEISLFITPVYTIFQGTKFIYRLPDNAYGEWLIFTKNEPKYYLDIFDPLYNQLKETVINVKDVEVYLKSKFSNSSEELSLKNNFFGIAIESKSFVKKFKLQKLPKRYFM